MCIGKLSCNKVRMVQIKHVLINFNKPVNSDYAIRYIYTLTDFRNAPL